MLTLNLKRVFRLRGIERPYSYLMQNGFPHMAASNLINGKTASPKIEHIELLCRMLNCTPNDLYEWVPETGAQTIAEDHQLNTLRRGEAKRLNDLIKGLPLERLNDVEELIKAMKEANS